MYSQLITYRGIAHEVQYTRDTLDTKECSEIIAIDQTPVAELEEDMVIEIKKKLDEKINEPEMSSVDQFFDDEGFFGDDKFYDEERNA